MVHYDGSKKGIALAKAIDAQFDLIAELADRNIRTPYANRGDVFLQGTVCPAVIVEGAFLSVDSDVEFLHERVRYWLRPLLTASMLTQYNVGPDCRCRIRYSP